jgi:hypothetical protein
MRIENTNVGLPVAGRYANATRSTPFLPFEFEEDDFDKTPIGSVPLDTLDMHLRTDSIIVLINNLCTNVDQHWLARNPKKAADFFKQPYSSLVTDVFGPPALTSPPFTEGRSLPR